MTLNDSEATDVNTLVLWMLPLANDWRNPTESEAREAMANLMEAAHKKLSAGLTSTELLERWRLSEEADDPPAHGPGCKVMAGTSHRDPTLPRYLCAPNCPRQRWEAEQEARRVAESPSNGKRGPQRDAVPVVRQPVHAEDEPPERVLLGMRRGPDRQEAIVELAKGVEAVIGEKKKTMPTRMEIERRQAGVMDLLARSPSINAGDVRRELSLNADAANHLLKMMEKAGKIVRHGVSSGTTWSPRQANGEAANLQPRQQANGTPRYAQANGENGHEDRLRGRYVALLIEHRPDRLLTLIEKGQLELTDDVLEAVEQVVFQ